MQIDIAADRPRVEVTLNDGSTAILSPLVPSDRVYLESGFEEMSEASRFARFGQGRHRLSDKEWAYLAEVDQVNHVAWAAAVDGEGAAVARYIRMSGSDCAEVAVTVLEPFQERGLATTLLLALLAVARADGVPEFCFEVVPSNQRVLEMLSGLPAEFSEDGGLVEARIAIDDSITVPMEDRLLEIMEMVRADLGG